MYRQILPEKLRAPIASLCEGVSDYFHNAYWRRTTAQQIFETIRKRLCMEDDFWLFILGLNNSGTTLLKKIIESHPNVRSLPTEGHLLSKALPKPWNYGVWRIWGTKLDIFYLTEKNDPRPALRLKYDWSRHFQGQTGILLEKSPPNTVRSRWLQANFAPCRFIAIVRSPYAVCEGIRRRNGHSIKDASLHWSLAHQCLWEDMKHLKHLMWFRYEDFCKEPLEHLTRIQTFLSLDSSFRFPAENRLDVHNIDQKFSRIQNYNWKSIEKLSWKDIQVINDTTATQMELFGYELM